jgi:hypothetical protein
MNNSRKAIWDCVDKFYGTKQRLIKVMEDRNLDSFEKAAEYLAEEAEFRADCEKDDRMMEIIEEESDEQPDDFFCEQEEIDDITDNEHEWGTK